MTDAEWLEEALRHASYSPDPNTKVGCVIVRRGVQVAEGYNHFPSGLDQTDERLNDRNAKLEMIIHGEMSAICYAAASEEHVNGATLYTACTDDTGAVFGGPPCCNCTKHVIQSGISRIVTYPRKTGFSKWKADLDKAMEWLEEAGIPVVEVKL